MQCACGLFSFYQILSYMSLPVIGEFILYAGICHQSHCCQHFQTTSLLNHEASSVSGGELSTNQMNFNQMTDFDLLLWQPKG